MRLSPMVAAFYTTVLRAMGMESIRLTNLDVDALRTRLRKMSDEELRKFGKAARYMVSPKANMGKPPLPAFVLQLEGARAEWRKRHQEESARD
jgi:hypothetical protein